MGKKSYQRGPLPVGESFKGETTKYVLNAYDGAMKFFEITKQQDGSDKQKKALRDAKIIRNYLVKERLSTLSVGELKKLYEQRKPGDESEQILLELFAKKAVKGDDLIWAYNTNLWDHIEVRLQKKMKKTFTTFEAWEEILEDESVGSQICKLAVEKLIPKANTLGKLLSALHLNKQNILQSDVKNANKAELLEKVSTIRISKEEAKIYKDEFEVKDGTPILKKWK